MCCTNWYKNAGCKFLVTKKRDNSYNIMLGITSTLVGSFIKVFQKPIREWERRTNVVVVIVFLFSSHIILLNEIYLQGLTLTKKWLFCRYIHHMSCHWSQLEGTMNSRLCFYMRVCVYMSSKRIQLDCIDSHKRY